MRARRSRFWKSARMRRSGRPARTRCTRWAGWCSPSPAGFRRVARRSAIPLGSNSRCWTQTRGGSSDCGCAGCRRKSRRMNDRHGVPPILLRTAGPISAVQRAALVTAGLAGWRRQVAAILLGALAAVALPPFDYVPLLVPSFVGLVWLEDGSADARQSFATGWSFGFGFFLVGLYWIGAALLVDAARFWWLLPFAVLGVPAGLSVFTGGALLASHLFCRGFGLAGAARILVLAVAWAGAEWLRGHVLTGFPWNLVGYVWAGGFPGGLAVLQATAYVGIYGLSLLTVLAAALPARLGDLAGGRRAAPATAVLMVAALVAGGGLRLRGGDDAPVSGIRLRLVQPSIPQSLKNDPSADPANFRRMLALTAAPGGAPPTVVVW